MERTLFRTGGVSALVFAVVMAAVAAYSSSVIGPPTTTAGEALQNTAQAPQALLWFLWAGTLDWLLLIPVALALYFTLRERDPGYTILALVATLFMALVVMVQTTGNAAVGLKLGQSYATGSPAEKAAALLIAESGGRWALMAVPGFIAGAVGIAGFGTAMLRSSAFPRWLGWVGIAGGALMLIGQLSWFIGFLEVVMMASWLVTLGWVFASGIYLLKFKPA